MLGRKESVPQPPSVPSFEASAGEGFMAAARAEKEKFRVCSFGGPSGTYTPASLPLDACSCDELVAFSAFVPASDVEGRVTPSSAGPQFIAASSPFGICAFPCARARARSRRRWLATVRAGCGVPEATAVDSEADCGCVESGTICALALLSNSGFAGFDTRSRDNWVARSLSATSLSFFLFIFKFARLILPLFARSALLRLTASNPAFSFASSTHCLRTSWSRSACSFRLPCARNSWRDAGRKRGRPDGFESEAYVSFKRAATLFLLNGLEDASVEGVEWMNLAEEGDAAAADAR